MERLTGSDMNRLTVATMQVEALRKQAADAQATIAALQAQLKERTAELERVRGLVKTYADVKTDFDDKRLQEDHHAWRERYTRLVGAETILIALTATSQPAKPQGRMHACDTPGCVSCGNPEDATSQEGQHGQ